MELEDNWAPPEYPKTEAEVARLQVWPLAGGIGDVTSCAGT